MRFIRWAAASVTLVAVLLALVGCEKKSTSSGDGGGQVVGSVQLVLPDLQNDTLRFLPGDSASTRVLVIVTDNNGLVMSGVKVNFTLADAELGSIQWSDASLQDTTNAAGRVNAVFQTFGIAGDQIIAASAGSKFDQKFLVIRESDDVISRLDLTVNRMQIEANESIEDSIQVTVTITDNLNNGIEGVSLPLRATGGRIIPLPPTDAGGRAQSWWYNNGQFGFFTLSVAAAGLIDSAVVEVREGNPEVGYLTVSSSSYVIEADGCISAATITATLKNQFNEAIVGDTIRFGSHLGAVESSAITDTLGVASVQFCGMSIPCDVGTTDSAYVIARYPDLGLRDTVDVWIAPAAAIQSVVLSASSASGTAGVDSVSLQVTARFTNNQPVNGYWVHFHRTECGSFIHDSLRLVNGSPDSANYYKLCTSIPQNQVELTAEVGGVTSEPWVMSINPGPPAFVEVFAAQVTSVGEPVGVIAAVSDTFGNPALQGEVVAFSTSVGSISPLFSNTDDNGEAHATYSPGTTAGTSIIRAQLGSGAIDSTSIQIVSGNPSTMTMGIIPSSLQVRGTGGQDWSQIQARVFDANGNPVPDGTWVRFHIDASPTGVLINSHATTDSAQTASGIALATLNAGTATGACLVSACVTLDGGGQACVNSTASVVAGPPFEIQIGVDEVGVDAGGAAWDVEISVLVKDAVQNPVRDTTAVFMDVIPFELAQILSQNVTTGNVNADNETHTGVAYSVLRYTSPVTNSEVSITARTANGTQASYAFILPVQEPAITLNCDPGSWHFGANGNPCHIRLIADVTDGHLNPINGQLVYYVAQRGRIHISDNIAAPLTSFAVTGPQGGFTTDGECILYLVENEEFIFPDPLTPEIPGEVRVVVVGFTDAMASQVINFRR
ncbi:Ig-like domain-containing protein [bacterium]|nr:Ig-like domain-containing protein [bacterium]